MGSIKKLEQALSRAGRTDVSAAAGVAAGRLADQAASDGLLDVAYTTMDSPVGPVLIAATQRGLVRISFCSHYDPDEVLLDLSNRISPRVIEAPSYFDAVRTELDEYFQGRRTSFGLPLDWRLTGGFGRRVLKHTARIPYGKVSTYKEMANAAGSPRAARAAGNALGSNPVPIVVPCHRVLHAGGGLGGYGGGLDNKMLLLKLEGAIGGEADAGATGTRFGPSPRPPVAPREPRARSQGPGSQGRSSRKR
jgi:methylated-DNA-[protein]-cysteine S-methyltransferase